MSWEVSSYEPRRSVCIMEDGEVIANLNDVKGSYEERLERARLICVLVNGHNAMMYEVGRTMEEG